MEAFEDPNHPNNGPEHHSGLSCHYEPGCTNPAGTAWSPYFCFPCNAKRMKRIATALTTLANGGNAQDLPSTRE